jgi:hypothetical protein
MAAAHESVLVDLVEIRSVCAAVVDWFDSYTAGTHTRLANLTRPSPAPRHCPT